VIDRLLVVVVQSNEELWAETAQRLTDEVQQIIEFAKFVPGFISLLQDDQIMLLKGGLDVRPSVCLSVSLSVRSASLSVLLLVDR